MSTFDVTKPVQTRDGRPARVICTDRKNARRCIVALVETDGFENTHVVHANGKSDDYGNHPNDLINLPERRSVWVNVYANQSDVFHHTKEHADNFRGGDRLACIELTYEVPPQ